MPIVADGLGRIPSVAGSAAQRGIWAACQMEKAKRNGLAILRSTENGLHSLELETAGLCHQPWITPLGDDGLALVWNESRKAIGGLSVR